jgi:hypothetical protein
VALEQLYKSCTQKVGQVRVGIGGQVAFHQSAHLPIVLAFAPRMHVAMAAMAPQVAVEVRGSVVQLVEHRDQLLLENLIEKPRQTECQQVEHFPAIHEISLNLKGHSTDDLKELTVARPERGEAGLQPVVGASPRLCQSNQHSVGIDVSQLRTAPGNVGTEPAIIN